MRILQEISLSDLKKIGYVGLLVLVMIYSSHRVDKKVMDLSAKREEIKKLKAIYVDFGIKLMRVKSKAHIKKKLEKQGLKPFNQRPLELIKKQNVQK